MASIPLCEINSGYNHRWRYVSRIQQAAGLWQCDQCHRIELGREPTGPEIQDTIIGKEIIVESVEAP